MAEVFKKRIVKLIKHLDYTPMKLAQMAKALGVGSDDYPQFKEAFEQLRQAGHLIIGERNSITVPALAGRVIGTFRANPRGFGFVVPLEPTAHGDLFIPPDATAGAMTGDIVAAKVVKKPKRTGQFRFAGRIEEVLQRCSNKLVGTLLKERDSWFVQPDGKSFFELISVDDVTAKNAVANDKVVVEIMSWPTEKYLARGVIIEVLGKAGRYDSEIRSIINQYHLPERFDEDCLNHARNITQQFEREPVGGREDITGKVVITIDPPSAKDFDDAISLEKDGKDNWSLGIHIADVGCFVPADSPLDIEAKDRGNSVYLPGFTIPMLPEVLSNGICSLQPGQRRFVKSAYITYDACGRVLSRRFAGSVICSRQRLTYQQADGALKGKTKGIKPEVVELLRDMQTLSRAIGSRRKESGMIHLDLPEAEVVLGKDGRAVDVRLADTSYPHTIIEMFMVEANEAVASLLDGKNVEFIRRIHPEPNAVVMKNLALLIRSLGYSLPQKPDRRAIQDLLAAAGGTDGSLAVNLAVLRSFEKAEYAPSHVGHYALASKCYCHFTSPIRRYADLMVHRLLHQYLQSKSSLADESANLTEIGRHISFTEQRAEDAERELKTVLILQMLSDRIGERVDCVVTGLTGFGVFAQLRRYGIEGLIALDDLGPDVWKFDVKTQCIVGRRTDVTIRMGKSIKCRIVSVNVPARQLKLSPAEALIDKAGKLRRAKPASRKINKRRQRRRSSKS